MVDTDDKRIADWLDVWHEAVATGETEAANHAALKLERLLRQDVTA